MTSARTGRLIAVVGVTAFAAFWMYIDRVCFGILADPIRDDLGLTDAAKGDVLGAFFLTYALFQIPTGTLADRYGPRAVLAASVAAWSAVTALTGFAQTFAGLVVFRLLLGVTESGAYPAAAGLVKAWAPASLRGVCSSAVALGGRLGGAAAPALTAALAVALVGVGPSDWHGTPAGVNWRAVFVVYGLFGLAVAGLFWAVVWDRPAAAPPAAAGSFAEVLGTLAGSRNLWLFGGAQFGANLGWAFLVTLLPSYLNEAFHVPLEERGRMQSVVLVTGCVGMVFGGGLTDAARAALGPRLGRSLPLAAALCGCAAALFAAPALPSAWAVVAALGVMAFLVDLHNPVIWSFAQDVGGRRVVAALGWGNMWGNLGAALSPPLLSRVAKGYGWDAVFAAAGGAFLLAAVCGSLLDARRTLEDETGRHGGPPASR
jgi:MFS family permease